MPEVDIVLTESFPILSMALVTEPLRVANRESADQVWRWRILSIAGGPMVSSSGMRIETLPLDDQRADIALLLSSYHPERSLGKPLLGWLNRRARGDTIMGCVDTGALIFAEAGLLDSTPAAAHYEVLGSYRKKFGDKIFVDQLFNVSAKRCSSAGGVATFDMTLGLIELLSGRKMADRVAEILTYRPTEHRGPQQRLLTDTSLKRLDRRLAKAIDLMVSTMDQPISIEDIAARIDVPIWTLGRLFNRYLKATPALYYRQLRLNEARNLMRNSNLRVSDVAAICGFEIPETFSRAFKKHFGVSPTNERMSATG